MKKINLNIKGLHCKSCEFVIKDALLEAGVKDCTVDHISGKSVIIFEESKLNENIIRSIIEEYGYEVNNGK